MEQQCDPGTLFNPIIGNCDLAQNVQCDLNACINVADGLTANRDSCSQFNICSGGQLISTGTCPSGLQFDQLTLRCTINANCFPGTGTTTTLAPLT